MGDGIKSCALLAAIVGLWCLVPQTGMADSVVDVPEPTSLSLLVGSLAGAWYLARRRGK